MGHLQTSARGYLAPDAGGAISPVAHLRCGGDWLGKHYKRWSRSEIECYMRDQTTAQADSLFRSFLFSPVRAESGRFLDPLFRGFAPPPDVSDWNEWLRELFLSGHNLDALSQSVTGTEGAGGKVDVWITLPYPDPGHKSFGQADKERLDFNRQSDRQRALDWWIGRFVKKWSRSGYGDRLSLRGFRWPAAMLPDGDVDLVTATAKTVHRHRLLFMWLPNYGADRVTDWQQLGFDITVLQPNYCGKTPLGREWIDNCALFAAHYGCGLQIACGRGLLYDPYHLHDYLNRGLPQYKRYMKEAFLVFQFDRAGMETLHRERSPLYKMISAFVRGTYEKQAYPGIPY